MVVLDASVILKWFREEKDSDRALSYRDGHIKGTERIICPILLHYELLNALITKRDLTMLDIVDILKELQRLQIVLVVPDQIEADHSAALIAMERGLSFYDASYIALAQKAKVDFITADKQLVERANLPFVKLL